MQKHLTIVCLTIFAIMIIDQVQAQRPSFAGSRPVGGLSQKDKYNNVSGDGPGIANRFGASDTTMPTVTIAYGQPQRPPLGGLSLVTPESVYLPLNNAAVTVQPQIIVNSRVGGTDLQTPTVAAAPIAPTNAVPATPTSTATQTAHLPLDAQGDQQLVDQLNRIPLDNRPFWFLNYQAIEAQRNGTGSTFAGGLASRGSFAG